MSEGLSVVNRSLQGSHTYINTSTEGLSKLNSLKVNNQKMAVSNMDQGWVLLQQLDFLLWERAAFKESTDNN